ncbi:MAG TPA: phosphatase PAP2 family protein [Steroidobacteraceae bacterium]|nr:phosphatase PAP2 family protein [Steroidobacteraceae bacterium]
MSGAADPFIALPAPEERANVTLLTLAFAAWFGLCYGTAAWASAYIPWRVSVELPLDVAMPFWPGAALLYVTIGPMMLLAPFVFRDLRGLLPLFAAFMLETSVGIVCFLLLPIDDAPLACCQPGWAGEVFRVADAMNLHHNNLPSLHVAFACTVALGFAPRASRRGAALLYAWALAVAVSTLFTRQHFLADVVAGMVLAVVCWRVAGSWARRPAVVAAFDVELLCLRNLARFARRHRRYLVIGIAVLAAGLPHWRRRRLARVGFVFLQIVDDLLDGHRQEEGRDAREPLEVADEMIASLESGRFAHHDLARLGAVFREQLLARGGPQALGQAISLVRAMRRDRERVLGRVVSTREELLAIHRATFGCSVDLMMLAADSPLRSHDVPLFIDALGWCSTVRDLEEDLEQGLVNIPADVFAAADAESPGAPLPALAGSLAVCEWLREESVQGAALLDRADVQIEKFEGVRGAQLLLRFSRSMRRYSSASSGARRSFASSVGAATSGQRTQ